LPYKAEQLETLEVDAKLKYLSQQLNE